MKAFVKLPAVDYIEGEENSTILIQSMPTQFEYAFVPQDATIKDKILSKPRFFIAGGQSSRSNQPRTSPRCFTYSEYLGTLQEEIHMYQSRKQFSLVHMNSGQSYVFAIGGL